MSEVGQTHPGDEAIRIAVEIVERHRHDFPEFVTDFRVVLGRSDGDPALFVLFKAIGEDGPWGSDDWQTRADAYRRLEDTILPELIDNLGTRFPYSYLVPDWQWESFPD